MHPVLFRLGIPTSWAPTFGPKSALFERWPLLLIGFVLGVGLLMWATSPEHAEKRKSFVWIGILVTLVIGLPLAGVGLVKLGEVKLHTYGVLISIGFLSGIAIAVREASRSGMDPEHILDFAFWVLVSAIVGSRVLYILTTWQEYKNDLGKLFRIWEGGLVFYGGLLACLIVAIWYVRRHNLSFWKISDICIPSVALGQAFGRLGCFAAGCCYGKKTEATWWTVKFTTGLAAKGADLYPTQLFSSLGTLTIFFLLLAIRSRKRYDGQVLVWYLFLYPIHRSIVEIFRGDKIRGFLFELDLTDKIAGADILTTSQFVSLILFSLGLASMIWLNKQYNKNKLAS